MAGGADILAHFRSRLIIRLVSAGLLWAAIAGIAAYFIETERLDETLVDQANLEARALDRQAHGEGGADVNAALDAIITSRASSSRDFFVLAELYDSQQRPLGESTIEAFDFVETKFDRGSHIFPALAEHWYDKKVIDTIFYLQVMVPLADQDGRPSGWFEGIYRISPETIDAVGADIATITALVVLAVLGTAAILYPLMANLQSGIVVKARELLQANLDTLKVLGNAIAKRDSDTNAHNYRVTIYAVRIAELLGLDRAAIRSLIKGSFLHDVGKIAIPDAILLKPGKLDEAEFTAMKTHVVHGLDIIAASEWLKDAAPVVGGHHEKVDGSGYPTGIRQNDIPISARIFAVADVFDALTSERPYKKAFPLEKALTILDDGAGSHFDQTVIELAKSNLPDLQASISALSDPQLEDLSDKIIGKYFLFNE